MALSYSAGKAEGVEHVIPGIEFVSCFMLHALCFVLRASCFYRIIAESKKTSLTQRMRYMHAIRENGDGANESRREEASAVTRDPNLVTLTRDLSFPVSIREAAWARLEP